MEKIKIFLAYGWEPKEEKAANIIIEEFKSRKDEFIIESAKLPKARKKIAEKIQEKVDQADATALIFLKRFVAKQDGKSFDIPSLYVISEAGFAYGRYFNLIEKKSLLIFYEKGIDPQNLGILRDSGLEPCLIDLDNLDQTKANLSSYIDSLAEYYKRPGITGNYRFRQIISDSTIYKNEYALVRNRCKLECLSNHFSKVTHHLALSPNAKRGLSLPELKSLEKNGVEARWRQKPFFNFRITEPASPSLDFKKIKIRQSKTSTEKKIDFAIDFKDIGLVEGTVINYEWSWGFPNQYPMKKTLLKRGREQSLDHCVRKVRFGDHPIQELCMVLRFEEPTDFVSPPIINAYDTNDTELPFTKDFEVQKSSLYSVFVAKPIPLKQAPPGVIKATWTPS